MNIFFDTNVYVAETLLGEIAEEMLAATEAASWRIHASGYLLDESRRRPSCPRIIREQFPGFRLQECDEGAEGDVAGVFVSFLGGERPFVALVRELIHLHLQLSVCPKFQEALRRLRSQAAAEGIDEPIQNGR